MDVYDFFLEVVGKDGEDFIFSHHKFGDGGVVTVHTESTDWEVVARLTDNTLLLNNCVRVSRVVDVLRDADSSMRVFIV